nr:hypothetical protein [Paludibacterium denitrificans]
MDDWLAATGLGDVLLNRPELEHVFSHYRLIITPLPVRLEALSATAVKENNGNWFDLLAAPDAYGVPAPVRRLLLRLAEQV